MNRVIRNLAKACMLLISTSVSAAPVQTFTGPLEIKDDVNSPSVLVGVDFDIDGNGTFDLNLAWGGILVNSIFAWDADARSATPGSASILESSSGIAKKFSAGEGIGPGVTPSSSEFAVAGSEEFMSGETTGEFWDHNGTGLRGFLGFSFLVFGATHYGWADIELDLEDTESGTMILHGHAYETLADTAILAGTPAVPVPAAIWLFVSAIGIVVGLGRRRQRD